MMTVRFIFALAVLCGATALSGCVSVGNTHALITPVGVAGFHTFKPAPNDRDILLPPQRNPDRIAATREQAEQENEIPEDET
jgi:hypothetical protein